jgi:hypothetical protein
MLLKRKTLAIILVSTIVVAGVAWLILSQIENQAYDVEITDFEWIGNWGTGPVGLMWGGGFNVTLRNSGNMDIEGLTVKVKMLVNNSEVGSETYFDGYNSNFAFGLRAGEIREFNGVFMTSLDEFDEVQGETTFRVLTMLNSTILDELTLPKT